MDAQVEEPQETVDNKPQNDLDNSALEPKEIKGSDSQDGRAKRERKPVSYYKADIAEVKSRASAESKGNGTPLGEISSIAENISKLKEDDETVKSLHSLLFGNAGAKGSRKKNFRIFSGFDSDATTEDRKIKLIENKKKWTLTVLKDVLGLFGLPKAGTREELCARVVEFLANPSGEDEAPVKARRQSGTKKSPKAPGKKRGRRSTDKGPPKKKRAPSAYLIFSSETRAEIRDANPGLSMIEVTQELAARWHTLDAEERKGWEEKALAAKAEFAESAEAEDGADEEDAEDDDEEDEDGKADELDEAVALEEAASRQEAPSEAKEPVKSKEEEEAVESEDKHDVSPEDKHDMSPEDKHDVSPEDKHDVSPEDKHDVSPEVAAESNVAAEPGETATVPMETEVVTGETEVVTEEPSSAGGVEGAAAATDEAVVDSEMAAEGAVPETV